GLRLELRRHLRRQREDIQSRQRLYLRGIAHARPDEERRLPAALASDTPDRALRRERRLLADEPAVAEPVVADEGVEPPHEDVHEARPRQAGGEHVLTGGEAQGKVDGDAGVREAPRGEEAIRGERHLDDEALRTDGEVATA